MKGYELLDGNQCAAWGARLAKVQYVPAYPITPQTEIIEVIAQWQADGEFPGIFQQVDSEHSVLSAALGSASTGVRTFCASSSQGLLLAHEIFPNISGTRLPMVYVNVSRGISAPITLWPDHNDVMSVRDFGWIMMISETNQEVLDSVILSYKVAEKMMLPVLVNMDGFVHSFTREQVVLPGQKMVDKFLGKPNLEIKLDTKNPKSLAAPTLEGYMYYRAQLHKAMLDSVKVIDDVHKEWEKLTGRKYSFFEEYKVKGADTVIVMMGSNTTIAKSAVDDLRKKGQKVGLLRIRVLRPWCEEKLRKHLSKVKSVKVVDQNVAPGIGGMLYPEVKSGLFGMNCNVDSYIVGLGGKVVSKEDFVSIFDDKGGKKWLM